MKETLKRKLIIAAIALAAIVGLLAYYHFVPLWATIVSTGAFLAGGILGWMLKGWQTQDVEDAEA